MALLAEERWWEWFGLTEDVYAYDVSPGGQGDGEKKKPSAPKRVADVMNPNLTRKYVSPYDAVAVPPMGVSF